MTTYLDIGQVDDLLDEAPSGATCDLVYIPDIGDRALAVTKSRLRKPRISALIRALAKGVQIQEDLNFALIVDRTIETASGVNLDQWGGLVGETRQGATDQDYRVYIKARILANRSTGYVNDLIDMWALLTAPYVRLWHVAVYPRVIKLYVVRSSFMSDVRASRVARLMEDARPIGCQMHLIEALTGYYGFADDPDAEGMDVGRFARIVH